MHLMNVKHLGLKVPADISDFLDAEADRLMCSRAVVVRQILARALHSDARELAFSKRINGNPVDQKEVQE